MSGWEESASVAGGFTAITGHATSMLLTHPPEQQRAVREQFDVANPRVLRAVVVLEWMRQAENGRYVDEVGSSVRHAERPILFGDVR